MRLLNFSRRGKLTAQIPSVPHVGFGSLHEGDAPLPPGLQAQNANAVFGLRHTGIDPVHAVEVPHLH